METGTQDGVPPNQGGESGLDSDKAIEELGKTRYLVMLETNGFGMEIIKSIKPMIFCKAIEYDSCSGVNDHGQYV